MDRNVTIASVGAFVHLGEDEPTDRLLCVDARLFAETDAGERLNVARSSMGAGMWRRGAAAIWKRYTGPPLPDDPEELERVLASYRVQRQDVEDTINHLLGRDPEQRRPPRLGWEPLIELLNHHGITMTEAELLTTPFEFEFSDALLAELAPAAGAMG